MKSTLLRSKRALVSGLGLVAVALVFAAYPLLSSARRAAPSVTLTNNSSREISHVYLSPVENEAWGPDQLNSAILGNGQSITLSGFSCSGSQIKVVAEDTDGCFVSAVFSCADDAVWTITNNTAADCGN